MITNLLHGITLLTAEADDDGTWVNTAGFFSNYMNIVAIVLIVVGLAIIYFGVKLIQGYTFHADETVIIEKDSDFVSVNAYIAERRTTEIPNYSASAVGKGNDLFKEMKITYSAEGGEYSHWISDNGEYDDSIPVKYNPRDPSEFYIDEGEEFEGIPDENGDLDGNEDDEIEATEADGGSKSVGITVLIVGILVLAVGVGILIDYLTR